MTTRAMAGLLTFGIASAFFGTSADAGGFNRGVANLDPLYNQGGFSLFSSLTYVAPARSFSTVSGGRILAGAPNFYTQGGMDIVDSYIVPNVSVGGRLLGDLSCAGSYTQPYGIKASYEGPMRFSIASQELETHEYGLTCGYGFDAGKGRLSLIGGVFYETVEFHQSRDFREAFGVSTISRIAVDSDDVGYRLGVGYEIPEIALRAQLMYRSQTEHNATGNYYDTPFAILTAAQGVPLAQALALYGGATDASASTSAKLPQNVEFSVQTGIAPGWLAFGSVKWTDWSVLKQIQITEGIRGQQFSSTNFYFKDGWTVTGGVGHKFTDDLGGSLFVTWDKGVTTGWDTLTDTWTIGAGLSYDASENFQIRAGGAAIYFADGEKDKVIGPIDYVASSPSEWGYALSISGSLKF